MTYQWKNTLSTSARSSSSSTGSVGTGLSTGSQPTTASAQGRIEKNQGLAQDLRESGQVTDSEDLSLIDGVLRFGAQAFDQSGLDSLLEFLDRGRKTIALGLQDLGGDAQGGYEIKAGDYWSVLGGNTLDVRDRIEAETNSAVADKLLGINNDISGSAVLGAHGWDADFAKSLPSWDIPILGMFDPKSLAEFARFGASLGLDVAADPISYFTAGMGGLGRKAAATVVDTTMTSVARKVATDLAEIGRKKASSYIDEMAAGTWSRLEVKLARETDEAAKKLVNLPWKEAVDEAMGFKSTWKMTNKGTDIVLDVPYLSNQGAAGRYIADLGDIMERKLFDSTDEAWLGWVDHAKKYSPTLKGQDNIMWTTGGVRAGLGFSSKSIPGITDLTRGAQGRLVRKATQSTAGKRIFESASWIDNVQPKWDGFRRALSRESAVEIAAMRQGGGGARPRFLHPDKVMKQVLDSAFKTDPLIKNVVANWTATEVAIRKWAPDVETAEELIDHVRRTAGSSGKTPNISHLPQELQDQINRAAKLNNDAMPAMARLAADIDPEIAEVLRSGDSFRPFTATQEYQDVMRKMVGAHGEKLNFSEPGAIEAFVEKHAKTVEGLTPLDVEMTIAMMRSYTPKRAGPRAFGESSILKFRQIGRGVMHLEGSNIVAFEALDEIDGALVRGIKAFADELELTGKPLEAIRTGKATAANLDPVEQIIGYQESLKQLLSEHIIAVETKRMNLGSDPRVAINTASLNASTSDIYAKVLKDVMEPAGEAVEAERVAQGLLASAEVTHHLEGSLKGMRSSPLLMENPTYARAVVELGNQMDEAARTSALFPHTFVEEVRKVRGKNPDLTSEAAEVVVAHRLLTGLADVTSDFQESAQMAIYRQTADVREMLAGRGIAGSELVAHTEKMHEKLVADAQQLMDSYREQYVSMYVTKAEGARTLTFDVRTFLENPELRVSLESAGEVHRDRAIKSQQRLVDALREDVFRAVGDDVSQFRQIRADQDLALAEKKLEVLVSELTDVPIASHKVTKVTGLGTFGEFLKGIGLNAEVVTETRQGLQARLAAFNESGAGVFFYHPEFGATADETYLLLRRIDNPDFVPARAHRTPEGRQQWFRENTVGIAPGVRSLKTKRSTPVLIVTHRPRDEVDQLKQLNLLRIQLNYAGAESIFVDAPNLVKPSLTLSTGNKYVTPFNLARSEAWQQAYKGKTTAEIMEIIVGAAEGQLESRPVTNWAKRGREAVPTAPRSEREIRLGLNIPAGESNVGFTQVTNPPSQGLSPTQSIVPLNPQLDADRTAAKLGMEFSFDTMRPELVEPELHQLSYPWLSMDLDAIEELGARYPRTIEEIYTGRHTFDELTAQADESLTRGRPIGEGKNFPPSAPPKGDPTQLSPEEYAKALFREEGRLLQSDKAYLDSPAHVKMQEAQRMADIAVEASKLDFQPQKLNLSGEPTGEAVSKLIQGVRRELSQNGFSDDDIDAVVNNYISKLSARREHEVKQATNQTVGVDDIDIDFDLSPDINPLASAIIELRDETIGEFRSKLPVGELDVRREMVFPPGAIIHIPEEPTVLKRKIAFNALTEDIPEGSVLREPSGSRVVKERLPDETRATVRESVMGREARSGAAQELEAVPPTPMTTIEAALTETSTQLQDRPYYNPKTHVIITRRKKPQPPNTVDVSRGGGTIGHGRKDGWGNPYVAGKKNPDYDPKATGVGTVSPVVKDDAEAVVLYRALLEKRMAAEPEFADKVGGLSGKRLWYYRGDGREGVTHAEVLADAADLQASKTGASKTGARITEPVTNTSPLRKVISGGQIGADRGGLEAGRDLGLETGGVAPRGFKTSTGSDPSLADFGVTEHASTGYPERTLQNVQDSDGTVLYTVSGKSNSPGSRLTKRYAKEQAKPIIENPTGDELAAFLRDNNIETLNVAGNREFTDTDEIFNTLHRAMSGAAPKVEGGVLEVSTKGDAFGKQFSALNAKIRGRGNRTIEDIYQTDIKGYDSIKEGKGNPPKDFFTNTEVEYENLWREWGEENPELMAELAQRVMNGAKLNDQFAGPGTTSQARSLTKIIDEEIERAPWNFRIEGNNEYNALADDVAGIAEYIEEIETGKAGELEGLTEGTAVVRQGSEDPIYAEEGLYLQLEAGAQDLRDLRSADLGAGAGFPDQLDEDLLNRIVADGGWDPQHVERTRAWMEKQGIDMQALLDDGNPMVIEVGADGKLSVPDPQKLIAAEQLDVDSIPVIYEQVKAQTTIDSIINKGPTPVSADEAEAFLFEVDAIDVSIAQDLFEELEADPARLAALIADQSPLKVTVSKRGIGEIAEDDIERYFALQQSGAEEITLDVTKPVLPESRRPITGPPPEGADEKALREWFVDRELQRKSLYTDRDINKGPVADDPKAVFVMPETATDTTNPTKWSTEQDVWREEAWHESKMQLDTTVRGLLERLFDGTPRSASDSLFDPVRAQLVDDIMAGPIAMTRALWQQEPGFKQIVNKVGVDMDRVARLIRQIEAGDVEAYMDPMMERFIALGNLHSQSVELKNITEELVDDAMDGVGEAVRLQLANAQRDFDIQIGDINKAHGKTQTRETLAFLEAGKQAGRDSDLKDRAQQVDEWLEQFAVRRVTINQSVSTMLGDGYQVNAIRGPDGFPLIVIDQPRSDRAVLQAHYGGRFDKAMDALDEGVVSEEDLLRLSMPQVVQARKARSRLAAITENLPHVRGKAAADARRDNMRDYFNEVMRLTQDAIDNKNPNGLRKLVLSNKRGTYVPTPQYKELRELLASSPKDVEFLDWFVNSGFVASLDAWDGQAFESWWHMQRTMQARAGASAELTRTLLNTATDKITELRLQNWSPDELSVQAHFLEQGTLALSGMRVFPDDIRPMLNESLNPHLKLDPSGNFEFPDETFRAQGGPKSPYARAISGVNPQSMSDVGGELDRLDLVIESLTKLTESNLVHNVDNKVIVAAMRAKEQLKNELLNPAHRELLTQEGHVLASELGVDTGVFAGMAIDKNYAPFIEATLNNSQVLFTPYVQSELSNGLRTLVNLWKAGATVARPSFHIRNLIGGYYNGFIAGVRHEDYYKTFTDVQTFRTKMAKLAREGVDDIDADVFEKYVIGALSEENQPLFRAAWESGTLQTSFARAEDLYDSTAKRTLKPWDQNFGLFQRGGQTMEWMEDHLRIATFRRHFDPTDADRIGAGQAAQRIVNAVHFDYTDLTSLEQNIKKLVPFYVWTRRNIPLQLQTLATNPSYMLMYYRARSNWNDQQLQQMEDVDPFTRYQASQGFLLPVLRDNDAGWARMVWDPQLPGWDIDGLPWTETAGINHPSLNPTRYLPFLVDMLGPALSVPMKASDDVVDAGGTNAPAGINAILAALDKIPVVGAFIDEGYPDPTASLAPDKDYRISKIQRLGIDTLMPYYNDFRAMLGVRPNNPYRASGEGWLPGESPGFDPVQRIMLGPLMRTFGRGGGLEWSSSSDLFFDSRDIQAQLEAITTDVRYRIGQEAPTSTP